MTDYEQTDLLTLAREARDTALANVENAADDWERSVIDQAIRAVADRGRPFSANTVRPLLPPGVRTALIGSRFLFLGNRAVICKTTDTEPSTDPGTHAKPLPLWIGGAFYAGWKAARDAAVLAALLADTEQVASLATTGEEAA